MLKGQKQLCVESEAIGRQAPQASLEGAEFGHVGRCCWQLAENVGGLCRTRNILDGKEGLR